MIISTIDRYSEGHCVVGRQGEVCCRQQVSLDVVLILATSDTLNLRCQHIVGHSKVTAGDKPEEGGDDVKSSCPLCPGLHTRYNGWYKGLGNREVKQIP